MEIVVKRVYGKVVDADMYPIHLIKNNYEKVLEVIEKDGNRYEKIIWFLLNSYEEVLRNLKKEDNLRQILNKKSGDGQTIKKYRANWPNCRQDYAAMKPLFATLARDSYSVYSNFLFATEYVRGFLDGLQQR